MAPSLAYLLNLIFPSLRAIINRRTMEEDGGNKNEMKNEINRNVDPRVSHIVSNNE